MPPQLVPFGFWIATAAATAAAARALTSRPAPPMTEAGTTRDPRTRPETRGRDAVPRRSPPARGAR